MGAMCAYTMTIAFFTSKTHGFLTAGAGGKVSEIRRATREWKLAEVDEQTAAGIATRGAPTPIHSHF